MIICERILCIANRKTMLVCVVNHRDIGIRNNFPSFEMTMFNHKTTIQPCRAIIRTDAENSILNGHRCG